MGTNSKVANRCDNCGSKQPTKNSKCSFCLVENNNEDTRRAFKERILEAHPDQTPRHIYADWLEDNGEHKESARQRRIAILLPQALEASQEANSASSRLASSVGRGTHYWTRDAEIKKLAKTPHDIIAAGLHRRVAVEHYGNYLAMTSPNWGDRLSDSPHYQEALDSQRRAEGIHRELERLRRGTGWSKEARQAAIHARELSHSAHEIEQYTISNPRIIEQSRLAAVGATSASRSLGNSLLSHRYAISRHQQAIELGGNREVHQAAIAAHERAIELKRLS